MRVFFMSWPKNSKTNDWIVTIILYAWRRSSIKVVFFFNRKILHNIFLLFYSLFMLDITRRWLQWSTMQQQLLTLLWREEGRPLRTTAMVISSFICCWLPYFVWLLPFQPQQRAYSIPSSVGFFFARLAAFSNVRRAIQFLYRFVFKESPIIIVILIMYRY